MTQDFGTSLKQLEAAVQQSQTADQQKAALQRLVTAYPLLYGYWMQLVALDPSAWEQALDACPSVELWHHYLQTHPSEENFQRAVNVVGRFFRSHPVWDLYLAKTTNKGEVLSMVTKIPLYNYGNYAGAALQFGIEPNKLEMAKAVSERWAFESKISRPYFHVVPIDEYELRVWDTYLDYEEAQGDIEQTKSLYIRCLVSTALYPGFWLRYIRWVSAFNSQQALDAAQKARHYHPENLELRLWHAFLLEKEGALEEALNLLSEDTNLRDVYKAMCERAHVDPHGSREGLLSDTTPEKETDRDTLRLNEARAKGDLGQFFTLDLKQNGYPSVDSVQQVLE